MFQPAKALLQTSIIGTAYEYIICKDGKINVCHHIKGHIPLLVYNSFKPYQFNISLPKFLVVTATPYGIQYKST
jgi:hypothetical protein